MKKRFFMIPVMAFFLFTACDELNVSEDEEDEADGGSGGGTPAAFAVSSFSLMENAVVNDLKPSITITFNRTVDAASVAGSAVTLDSGGTAVSVALSVSGPTITAMPQLHLENTKTCTLTVGTAVKDTAAAAKNLGAVWVAGGTNPITATISLIGGVSLLGGYSTDFTSRDFSANETIITSDSLGSLVSVSDAALTNADVLEGFTIDSDDYSNASAHAIAVSCSGSGADYHLVDSGGLYALNLGLDANSAAYGNVTIDIDGDARQAGSYDRGADEKLYADIQDRAKEARSFTLGK